MTHAEITNADPAAAEIGGFVRKGAEHWVEAGRRLRAKKEEIGHGGFLDWIDANAETLGFSSDRTAQRLMKAAERADSLPKSNATFVSDAQIDASVIWGNTPNGARADRLELPNAIDYYPTPPIATRALMEVVWPQIGNPLRGAVLEPACGGGHMAEVLAEYFPVVAASDLGHYGGYGKEGVDFLKHEQPTFADWIITNPPFNEAEAFALRALSLARVGVAMFLRMQWLETVGRYENLFSKYPPQLIAQFAERVPLHKGRWEPEGVTTMAYLWIVWRKGHTGDTRFFWIPPGQRKALAREDDLDRFVTTPVIKKEHRIVEQRGAR